MKVTQKSLIVTAFGIAFSVFPFYGIYAFHQFNANMNPLIISMLALSIVFILFALHLAHSEKDKKTKPMLLGTSGIVLLASGLLAG